MSKRDWELKGYTVTGKYGPKEDEFSIGHVIGFILIVVFAIAGIRGCAEANGEENKEVPNVLDCRALD
jgi:hypothetical protein